MKTDNIVILKNLHNYDDYEDADFYICIESDLVRNGFLHDTYNRYGQALDSNEASDYSLGNTDSTMASDVQIAISTTFKDFLRKFAEEDDVDVENDREYLNWIDSAIHVDSDGTVELNGEENEDMTAFARKYDEANRIYTTATYVNYWDGSNWQTLLCSADSLDFEAFEEMDDKDEDYLPLIDALKQYDLHIDEGVYKCEIIGRYEISHSLYANDYFVKANYAI